MFKRAIGIGLLIFLLSLLVNAMAAHLIGINIKTTSPNNIPPSLWLTGIFTAVILSISGSWWFFRSKKIQAGVINGGIFGIIICMLGFILDIIALLPYKNGVNLLMGYYVQKGYWIAFILIIISSTLVGYYKSKGN